MKNDDEIDNLIEQLKTLQLQQQTVINRIEAVRNRERRAAANNRGGTNVEGTVAFTIGDRVRILNPSRFQANRGTIIRIGDRITVQTATGNKIVRAPKNLVLDNVL
jgi:hypothetical protein